ncbi:MAG: hypothetical protein L6290_12290 [Thermodesulfovibrionales bacterium]|nr:hypothetical protein [Thermodesulfovibrionales bacterium]
MERKDSMLNRSPLMISFRQIGLLIISFLLGFASFGLLQNTLGNHALTFSTPALLGFVISILLAGASIVLAVAAIMLGKFSEQSMIQRSDESIRLQNEVFQKTTDALQRIESSTGVTEKRIEDIISGRVGDISHRIAEIATEGQKRLGKRSFSDIEKEIRNSLMQTLRQEDPRLHQKLSEEERQKKRAEAEQREKEYQTYHQRVMSAFANRDDLKMQKAGHGYASNTGDELFDGIFVNTQGIRVAASTFMSEFESESFQMFVKGALAELYESHVHEAYMILFSTEDRLVDVYMGCIKVVSPELKKRIHLLIIDPEKIEKTISELDFSNKSLESASETPEG